MKDRIQLVLDIGGVLLSDLRPGFWMALASSKEVKNLEKEFIEEFKYDFWSGRSTLNSFFSGLKKELG